MSKRVRICMEVNGLAVDDNGQPCPVGLSLLIGDENGEDVPGEEYQRFIELLSVESVLREMCLDAVGVKAEHCRIITPQEYDEKFGNEA